VEGWDYLQPKRVTGSAITKCSFPRPEGVVQERVPFPKAQRRGTGAGGTIYCHWAEGSATTQRTRAWGKHGVTTVQALGKTPAERGTHARSWECCIHTKWVMTLCPISMSSEDPWRGEREGNSPSAKTTGSPRTKGGMIEGGARTQSPWARPSVCQVYAPTVVVPYTGQQWGGTVREG
jgi:hypothetical protein